MTQVSLRLYSIPRMLRHVRRPFIRYLKQKELQRQTTFADALLAEQIRTGVIDFDGRKPVIRSAILTRSDVVIIKFGADQTGQELLLKLPLSEDAITSSVRHEQVIRTLHQNPRLPAFLPLVPKPVSSGKYKGRPYYVESVLPGIAARDLLDSGSAGAPLEQAAGRAIAMLHAATSRQAKIDEPQFEALVLQHVSLLHRLAAGWPDSAQLRRRLELLQKELRQQIVGRTMSLAWIHGDFWLGNVLVTPENQAVSGIVDWDRAVPDALPLHDLLHLLLYTRKLVRGTELGEEVVRWLQTDAQDDPDRTLITEMLQVHGLAAEPDLLRAAVLLYWLRLVAINLTRYPKFHTDTRWLKKNVFLVLQQGFK